MTDVSKLGNFLWILLHANILAVVLTKRKKVVSEANYII